VAAPSPVCALPPPPPASPPPPPPPNDKPETGGTVYHNTYSVPSIPVDIYQCIMHGHSNNNNTTTMRSAAVETFTIAATDVGLESSSKNIVVNIVFVKCRPKLKGSRDVIEY